VPLELIEIFRKPLAENLKTAMPTPEIPDSVPPIAYRLAIHFGNDVAFTSPQKPCPEPIRPKNNPKLDPFTFPNPEPAVDDEPRRW